MWFLAHILTAFLVPWRWWKLGWATSTLTSLHLKAPCCCLISVGWGRCKRSLGSWQNIRISSLCSSLIHRPAHKWYAGTHMWSKMENEPYIFVSSQYTCICVPRNQKQISFNNSLVQCILCCVFSLSYASLHCAKAAADSICAYGSPNTSFGCLHMQCSTQTLLSSTGSSAIKWLILKIGIEELPFFLNLGMMTCWFLNFTPQIRIQ